MSNPAVTRLCHTNIAGVSMWMDDNIGESIHIHIGDVRVDLTNSEFERMYSDVCDAINEMVEVEGFDCHKINPVYLEDMLWRDISDLKKVSFENVELKEMLCPFNGDYRKLPNSRAVKALNGDSSENDDKRRSHHIGQSSKERLDTIYQSIYENGYPYNGEYIVMYGNDNVIQDGQHRAACLWKIKGDVSVPVMRLHFDNYVDWDSLPGYKKSIFHYRLIRVKNRFGNPRIFIKKLLQKANNFFIKVYIWTKRKKYLLKNRKQYLECKSFFDAR